jgi:membrane-bound lytic murein transglycosylase MltF
VQSGVLRAVTEYNSISFHVQEDTLGGLHYELLHAFAQTKGLKVEITPEMRVEKRLQGIQDGTYDILANNVMINSEQKDSILFTLPILLSRQILVQRKPQEKNDNTHIKSLLELAHRTVHLVKGSPSILRIQHLSNEIGDTIYIQEVERYGQEQLLAMVANGDIDYAICDENIALTSAHHLPLLDIETAISFSQFYSWGVNRENTILLDSLNTWLEDYKRTASFQELIKKYTLN